MTTRSLPSPVSAYVERRTASTSTVSPRPSMMRLWSTTIGSKSSARSRFARGREIVGDLVTMKVIDQRRLGNRVALKAEVDGDFDKKGLPSPFILTFYLSVEPRQDFGARHREQKGYELEATMPVYMIYVCHSVSERALLEKYWASIGPTLEGQPVKMLAAYTPFEVLERDNVLGVFIGEWPSMDAAKACYDSSGYKDWSPSHGQRDARACSSNQALRRLKRGCTRGSARGAWPERGPGGERLPGGPASDTMNLVPE
jgi:uncharacterized protein (DUF1330 family)